jgi:16S rRNA (uracil1498-N3)-methyltransferase
MQLFFDPEFSPANTVLNAEESKHCIRVLRHVNGDEITILNGHGTLFTAQIIDANPKACKLEILNQTMENERPFCLHMVVAPTKNIDRFEWFLEKATEIGIEQITPIICEHSERKIIKPERLEKVIIAATKQSLKSYKPILNPIISFKDFIANDNSNTHKFIAHCYNTPKELLKDSYSTNTNVTILIGPEGDFSEEEVKRAMENGFIPVSLGKSRLRTETAAIMGCATINLINQID